MTAGRSYLVSDVRTLGLARRVTKNSAKVGSSIQLRANQIIPQMIRYKEIKQVSDTKDRNVRTVGRKDKKQNISPQHLLAISLTSNPNLRFDSRTRSAVLHFSRSVVQNTLPHPQFPKLPTDNSCICPYAFAIVSTFAHSPLYLPLHIFVYPWSSISTQLSSHLQAIYLWPVCPCMIYT